MTVFHKFYLVLLEYLNTFLQSQFCNLARSTMEPYTVYIGEKSLKFFRKHKSCWSFFIESSPEGEAKKCLKR